MDEMVDYYEGTISTSGGDNGNGGEDPNGRGNGFNM